MSKRFIGAIICIGFIILMASPAEGAWLSGWDNRIKLRIDSSKVDSTLTNFPVLLYLSAASGIGDEDVSCVFDELALDANRRKIAVTTSDGTTECYVEIEKWDDANEKAWLWVKVPSISSSSDTDLYLYYDVNHLDNGIYVGDTNSTPAESVWDDNYVMVQHLADGASTSATYDSTSNNNDGTKKGANEPIETNSGKIDDAQDFDGGDDYLTTALGGLPTTMVDITVAFWASPSGTLEHGSILRAVTDDTANRLNIHFPWDDSTIYWDFGDISGNGRLTASWNSDWNNVWAYWVFISEAGVGQKIYRNNTLVASDANVEYFSKGTKTLEIAKYNDVYWDGIIDEFRISSYPRSAAWIKASYNSGNDSFVTFGAAEGRSDWLSGWDQRIKLTVDSTKVDENLTDFPALVYLSAASGIGDVDVSCVFDELTSDDNRKKIAVTTSDGQTQCYVEIEKWDDASEEAWLWVKIPSVSSIGDSYLYLYYDADHADNTTYIGDTNSTPAENVWNSHFKGVWHLDETTGSYYDSTDSNYDGTLTDADTDSTRGATGKINGAIDLNGDADYIDCGDVAEVDSVYALTYEVWMKDGATNALISKYTDDNSKASIYNASGDALYWSLTDGSPGSPSYGTSAVLTGEHYLAMAYDGLQTGNSNILKGYVDGEEVTLSFTGTIPALTANHSENLYLGKQAAAYTDGIIDEVRISSSPRSAAWIKASYNSGNDSFITFTGTAESPPSAFSGWDNRIKLTIDSSKIDSDLTNFPVLIHISSASGITDSDASRVFDELTSDDNRKKIAVTTSDGQTQCFVEIEKWDDASEEAWLWVKVPAISSTNDTDLYLYYDADHPNNTYYVGDSGSMTDIWGTEYVMVQHLEETSGTHYDSTFRDNDSSVVSVTTQGSATGKIDGSDEFAAGKYIDCGTDTSLDFAGAFTVSAWVKPDTLINYGGIVSKVISGRTGTYSYMLVCHNDGTIGAWGSSTWNFSTDAGITAGNWYHLTWKLTGGNIYYFVNGTAYGSDSFSCTDVPTHILYIGSWYSVNTNYDFDGIIDEVRVSYTARSDAWIKASYYSEADLLLTFEGASDWGVSDYAYRKQITVAGSTVGELANYQMKLTVHKGSGSDSGSDVYLSSHCQDDFDDIRFTADDGTTQLDYWRESYTSGDNAVFWIEFPAIPASSDSANFYIYYDNSSASSATNGDETFVFFDDFTGTTIDTDKWNETDTGGNLSQNDKIILYDGTGAWTTTGLFTDSNFARTSGNAYREFRCKYQPMCQRGASYQDTTMLGWKNTAAGVNYAEMPHATYYITDGYDIHVYEDSIARGDVGDFVAETQYWLKTTLTSNGAKYYNSTDGDSWTLLYTGTASSASPLKVGFTHYQGGDSYVDDVFVRNCATTEPTFGTWGSEESGPAAVVTNSVGPTNVTATTARLNGEITDIGFENPTVHIYWGDEDGGTTPGSWDTDENLGTKSAGTFYQDVSSLTTAKTYYYRCYATHSGNDNAWAPETRNFTPSNFGVIISSDGEATIDNSSKLTINP